jgi:hypothetical protein
LGLPMVRFGIRWLGIVSSYFLHHPFILNDPDVFHITKRNTSIKTYG